MRLRSGEKNADTGTPWHARPVYLAIPSFLFSKPTRAAWVELCTKHRPRRLAAGVELCTRSDR